MAQLSDVLSDVGSIISQDTTLPTGTDLSTQTAYVNQAIREWANSYQPRQLRVTGFSPTFNLSATSIGLPITFKKLMSRPFNIALSTSNDYEEIRPEDRYRKTSTDRYCYTGGDPAWGYWMVINPALSSGVSLSFDYQAYPSLVSNTADFIVCPNTNFIVKRVLSKVFESRADPRFPTFKQEADDSLAHAMEEEAVLSGGFQNKTPIQLDKYNMRIGEF